MKSTSVLSLLALAASASAHTIFQQIMINGVDQERTSPFCPYSVVTRTDKA
jgi:hypothetical protein